MLRQAIHALGLRFRLHRRIDRYRPDLVLPKYRAAVFVDGCFWHACPLHGPKKFHGPNAQRWTEKLATNQARDVAANAAVIQAGWRVLRIWECEIKTSPATAAQTVLRFVQSDPVIEV